MTSLLFPDSGTRFVQYANGDRAVNAVGTLYADAAGTVLAEIYHDSAGTRGTLITDSKIVLDAFGQQPDWWGPASGTDHLWITVSGGPLCRVDAAYGQRIAALDVSVVHLANPETVTGPKTFNAGTLLDKGSQVHNVRAYGATGDGVTDDTTAIRAAITAATPGGTVYLPTAVYRTSGPLTIPPYVTLLGTRADRSDGGYAYASIKPLPSFTGTSCVSLVDQATGGYITSQDGVRLVNIDLDGTAAPGTTDGIRATGRVHGVVLDRVCVEGFPGVGLNTAGNASGNPYSWNLWHCSIKDSGGVGYTVPGTDCTLINCYAINNVGRNFVVNACANTVMIGCRSEWSGSDGVHITGNWQSGQGSGGLMVSGLTTDRNNHNGILIDATGAAQINLHGLMCRRDGRNGVPGVGGGGYAALNVANSTMRVTVDGITVYPGVADDGSGSNSPQYGVTVTGSDSVRINSGYIHADTTAVNDGGGNTNVEVGPNLGQRTGPPSSPTTVTRGLRTPVGLGPLWYPDSGTAQDLLSPNTPGPDFHGAVGWSFDPALIQGVSTITAGTVVLVKVRVRKPSTVGTLSVYIGTQGNTLTTGQNLLALFDSTGTQVGVTADLTSSWASANTVIRNHPLVAPYAATPRDYYVAFLANGTTSPTFGRAGNQAAAMGNWLLGTSALRFATNVTGQTAMPGSLVMGSNAPLQNAFWVGLS